jgi:ribose transport system permease protein
LAGIKIRKRRIFAFVLAGLLAAIGGIILSSRLGVGHPQGGDGFLLNAFAAAFLGAATIRDEFHIPGTFIGVLLVGVAINGLTIMSVPFWVQNIFTGVVLIFAVSFSGIIKRSA